MLAENLKIIREEKQYSKLRLGREAGLTARCIEHIENKKARNPRIQTLQKLAKALGVSVDELLK